MTRVLLGLCAAPLAACGDDTGNSAGETQGSGSGTTQNGSTGGSTDGPATSQVGVTEATSEGTGTATQGMTTGDPPTSTSVGPTTDSSATQTTTQGTSETDTSVSGDTTMGVVDTDTSGNGPGPGTDSSSGGLMCQDAVCNGECCDGDQVCVEEQCQKDCGGPPPCGPQEDCCTADELCYLGACVKPGPSCAQVQCATQQANDCAPGFVCDAELELCLPSKADANCIYKPPPATFKPRPTFTWGTRKQFACVKDIDCQTAEVCLKGFCAPDWPHLTVKADDFPTHTQSSSTAAVVDLDRDCVPEVIFNTYVSGVADTNGVLRAIRGDNGAKVWTVSDPAYRTNSTANPAVGDLNGDGDVEIIVPGETKNLLAFTSKGVPLWKSDPFTAAATSSAVAIANLDNDGDAEVIYADAVYNSAGKKLFEGNAGEGGNGGIPISCVADLDGDSLPELIAGKTAYYFSGKVQQNTFTAKQIWNSTVTDGFCGVADFNGDKKPEVIIVSAGMIYALNGTTGVKLAEAPIPNGGKGGPPNIADFDGDGKPEVAAAGSSQYIVYKYAGGATFTKLWSAATDDDSSQVTGSSVFDFDGDGRNEVVYNDEVYIRIYPGVEPDCQLNPPGPGCDGNMTDAEVLFRDKNGSRTRTEYPVIADVDGDFKAEIVFPTNNDGGSGKFDAGLEVWGDELDNWVATRPVWNQHTYHITNVIHLV